MGTVIFILVTSNIDTRYAPYSIETALALLGSVSSIVQLTW